MSHELRTPLNAILGYTELIVDGIYGDVPEKLLEVLERVQQSGQHLLGLINAVLDLSKIEAGQLVLSLQEYSLKEVVYAVCTLVGRERLVDGNSALAATGQVASVAGPSLAGVLVQLISAPLAILADVASFVASALCLGTIRRREVSPMRAAASQAPWHSLRQEVAAGCGSWWRSRCCARSPARGGCTSSSTACSGVCTRSTPPARWGSVPPPWASSSPSAASAGCWGRCSWGR
jgi:hypothetical protein